MALKTKIVATFATLIFFGIATPVEAATLYSNDTFDPSTSLWTYNYIVDDTSGGALITHVDIFVGGFPTEPQGYYAVVPIPPVYTAPSGWTMYGVFDGAPGLLADPPYNELGGFYQFYSNFSDYNHNGIFPGQIVSGFSVTTSYAPSVDGGGNDYILEGYEGTISGANFGVQGYGNVIVPHAADWLIGGTGPAPIPSSSILFASGLTALGLLGWRRKRKNASALAA